MAKLFYTGGEFVTAPEGQHRAVCVDVTEPELKPTKFGDKQLFRVYWQLETRNEDTAKRFIVSRQFSASMHEKSNFVKMLGSWRGKTYTRDELEAFREGGGGFDTECLIGKNCQINITHSTTTNGNTYANVDHVMKAAGDFTMEAEEYVRVRDRETSGNDGGEGHDDSSGF